MVQLRQDGIKLLLQDLEIHGNADLIQFFGLDENLDGPIVPMEMGAVTIISAQRMSGGKFPANIKFEQVRPSELR